MSAAAEAGMSPRLDQFRVLAIMHGEDHSYDTHAAALWCRDVAVQVSQDDPQTFHIQIHDANDNPRGVYPGLDAQSARILWVALIDLTPGMQT